MNFLLELFISVGKTALLGMVFVLIWRVIIPLIKMFLFSKKEDDEKHVTKDL